jgi:negative regulator of flagellin synthesis FlgM
MTAINGVGVAGSPQAVSQKTKVRADSPAGSAPASSAPTDTLELTDVTAQVNASAGFDAAKVESIKSAIASGNYPVDARSIAKSFAELENLVSTGSGK